MEADQKKTWILAAAGCLAAGGLGACVVATGLFVVLSRDGSPARPDAPVKALGGVAR